MKTLLLVDIQNDFLPGGALEIKKGNMILPVVQELLKAPFDLIVATKDWHPFDHGSFAENYNKKPGEHIELNGIDQILWPRHCVQDTKGAEFASELDVKRIHHTIYKGTDSRIDSYSTFFDNLHLRSTGLEEYLKEKKAKKIYIAGLATDYCVKFSVIDALHLGFETYVIVDACQGIDLQPDDCKKAFEEMQDAGAILTTSKEVVKEMSKGSGKPKQQANRAK